MSKLVILSSDAMVGEDLAYLKTLPNYRKYLQNASEIINVRSVYPTLTYPAHVSMISGTYPDKHKVVSNYQFRVGEESPPWCWFHDAVKVPDLFTAAKKAGLSTASVFWPVTGCHPDVDYLIAEYWTQGKGDSIPSMLERSGSSPAVMEIVRRRLSMLEGNERQHPACDEFVVQCACDIIEKHRPDVIALHPASIDDYRHRYGLFNAHVRKGVEETDRWIGQLMRAVETAGAGKETNFFLVSDHGQLEIKRVVALNVLLADAGLIRVSSDGKVQSWDAYVLSGGMSALVFLKDPSNQSLVKKTYEVLCALQKEGVYGLGQVFTKEEAAPMRLSGDFSFVIETDGYTSFSNDWTRPLVRQFDLTDYRFGRATHGYLPQLGPQPILVAKGPGIRENVSLDGGRLVDEAPTYAALLGVPLPQAEGKAISALLR